MEVTAEIESRKRNEEAEEILEEKIIEAICKTTKPPYNRTMGYDDITPSEQDRHAVPERQPSERSAGSLSTANKRTPPPAEISFIRCTRKTPPGGVGKLGNRSARALPGSASPSC